MNASLPDRQTTVPLLQRFLDQRAAPDAGFTAFDVVLRDLLRYYALIHASLPCITDAQARWLTHWFRSALRQRACADFMDALHHLPLMVRDALHDPSCDLDPTDGQALLAAVRAWTLPERAAVLDALERVALAIDHGTPLDAAIRTAFMAD